MAVHPRACGEQAAPAGCRRHGHGSSPRLRGTGPGLRERWPPGRFIPAPAGNSPARWSFRRPPPVHPRACGEQLFDGCDLYRIGGSSPRLRGTEVLRGGKRLFHRFIPAPAGNSGSAVSSMRRVSVHPRACGEQWFRGLKHEKGIGSSPRLRGTDANPGCDLTYRRFIPAPAGNSL